MRLTGKPAALKQSKEKRIIEYEKEFRTEIFFAEICNFLLNKTEKKFMIETD